MKKLILIFFAVILTVCLKAQSAASVFCVSINCPITIQLPVDSALIFGMANVPTGDTLSTYKWMVTGPAATLSTPASSQTMVKGLNTPGIYTFSLTVTTIHGAVLSNNNSQVIVLPAIAPPPPPRTVTSIQILVDGVMITIPLKGSLVGYSDGSSQQN